MQAFRYEAVDARRQAEARTGRRRNARQVRDRLRAEGLFPTAIDAEARRRGSTPGQASSVQRLRLPAAQVALSTRQLATLVRSGMPLDQALSAVAEQADDARAAKLFARARARWSPRASRSRVRFPGGRERSRISIAAWSRSRPRPAASPMSSTRLADYLEARQAQKQQFTLALVYPGAGDDHRLRGDRRAAGLCRAADRLRLRAEPPDAALAHAGADRAFGLPPGNGVDLGCGCRGSDRRALARESGARRSAHGGSMRSCGSRSWVVW